LGAEGSAWLRAAGLTKVYGGVVALDSASLEIAPGEIQGLVGANGAGKSTLVKILTGIVRPTSGRVLIDGKPLPAGMPKESLRAGIVSVPQELVVGPTMTVAENVMLGHEPRGRFGLLRAGAMRQAAARVLESLSLEIPVNELAGRLPLVEQRLVMIARALSFRARMVIFDEPTATVSPAEAAILLEAVRGLRERGVSVLYVSHRLDEIEALCDSVTVLRDGRVVSEAAGARSHAELVELLAGEPGEATRAPREPEGGGAAVLEIRDLQGERLQNVSLSVRSGEIAGLAGLAGSGARELLLTVCGAVPYRRGTIQFDGRMLPPGAPVAAVAAGIGFLPGDRSLAAFPAHSVRHNVSLAALARHSWSGFVRRGSERSAVAELLDRVALRANPEALIASLSGGNQQKAILARWIASGAKLLLLDDPTAGVDVATRPELQAQIFALRDAGAAVLLVSTDIDELARLCDRVVTFDRGAITGELTGAQITPTRVLAAMTQRAEASSRTL